jgi:hypothetical protein
MREGDLVRFNTLACNSWPHDYRSDLPLVLLELPRAGSHLDTTLVLGEGRMFITHLRFLEPLEVGA